MKSGIRVEVGWLEELLDAMLNAQKDIQGNKDNEKVVRAAVKSRKEQFGERLVAKWLSCHIGEESSEVEVTECGFGKLQKVSVEENSGI